MFVCQHLRKLCVWLLRTTVDFNVKLQQLEADGLLTQSPAAGRRAGGGDSCRLCGSSETRDERHRRVAGATIRTSAKSGTVSLEPEPRLTEAASLTASGAPCMCGGRTVRPGGEALAATAHSPTVCQ